MPSHFARFLATVAISLCASRVALASSTAGSSAADSASSATSSASDSLKTSSNGSSKATGIAQGEYKIIAITAQESGKVQLALQLTTAHGKSEPLSLTLAEKVFADSGLAEGQLVTAKARTYGVEFSRTQNGRAFLLVLEDAIFKELNSVAVSS
jgi:hypothetical protein